MREDRVFDKYVKNDKIYRAFYSKNNQLMHSFSLIKIFSCKLFFVIEIFFFVQTRI